MASAFSRSIKGDRVIWIVVIMLFLFSILAVYSSFSRSTETSIFSPLLTQSLIVMVGLFTIYFFHNLPIIIYRKIAIIGIYASIFLLVYMLLGGMVLNDAKRSLRILGFTFQPADVAKIAVVLYLAKVFEDGDLNSFEKIVRKIILPIGIICALLLFAEVSSSILVGAVCFSVMFIAGVKKRYLLYTIIIAIVSVLSIHAMEKADIIPGSRISVAMGRFAIFSLSDEEKAKKPNDVYQEKQAEIAISSSGIVGKGPGNSIQRHSLSYSYTDYIYAIIIEEYGLLVGVIILMGYLWLLYRAVIIAKKCSKIFPVILVLGLSLVIVFQAIVHMGVSVGIFPVTGVTLPFVSHGGSSILFMSIALGITLAVSRTADNQELSLIGVEQDGDEVSAQSQKQKA